ncbi:MAG: LD-carboxypeptidase [Sulfolobales archaeon]
MRVKIKPPKIKHGARILLVAPSSYPEYPDMNLSMGIETLRKYGFSLVLGDSVKYAMRRWYLAAPEEVKVMDLAEGFRMEDVDAVWCVRGGAGSVRLLDSIDYDLIASSPKPLIGFSDITVLQNALYSKTGLASIHGEMVATIPKLGDEIGAVRHERNLEMVLRILQEEVLELRPPEDGPFPKTINSGKASGEVVGGNLIHTNSGNTIRSQYRGENSFPRGY